MKQVIFAVLATIALSACATTNAALVQALAPAQSIGTEVACDSGCILPWQRAQLWVANHSRLKIQTATDVMIQTYNATDYDAYYSFTITKTPQEGAGRYAIAINMVCGNPFGCSPKSPDVRSAFLYYVQTGRDLLGGQSLGQGIQ